MHLSSTATNQVADFSSSTANQTASRPRRRPQLNVNGTLYSTTAFGGNSPCRESSYGRAGFGTVFKITTSCTERLLYHSVRK
jgi:hypothetical protein